MAADALVELYVICVCLNVGSLFVVAYDLYGIVIIVAYSWARSCQRLCSWCYVKLAGGAWHCPGQTVTVNKWMEEFGNSRIIKSYHCSGLPVWWCVCIFQQPVVNKLACDHQSNCLCFGCGALGPMSTSCAVQLHLWKVSSQLVPNINLYQVNSSPCPSLLHYWLVFVNTFIRQWRQHTTT